MAKMKNGKKPGSGSSDGSHSGINFEPDVRNLRDGSVFYDGDDFSLDDDAIVSTGDTTEFPDEPQKQDPVAVAYGCTHGGIRNYRNYMEKYGMLEEAKMIVEDGIGRSIDVSELDHALYDSSLAASDFKQHVASDYAEDLHEREIPRLDENGDGHVDQDDVVITPGMRRMAKYL